jgi:hypothetical protein
MKHGLFEHKKDAILFCNFNNGIDKKNGYFVGVCSGVECFTNRKIFGYCIVKF